MLKHLVREFILPPGCLLVAGVVLLCLSARRPKLVRRGSIGLLVLVYCLSIPLVSIFLTQATEEIPARSLAQIKSFAPQAIAVPGAGVYRSALEYQGEAQPSLATYQRLAYANYLEQRMMKKLPVLVSGGYGASLADTEGFVAAKTLSALGVSEVWMETEAENTMENALKSREIARKHGVNRILLVTSASHAARASEAYRSAGFEVLACPTGFRTPGAREHGLFLLVPNHHAFSESCYAFRTLLARLWYILR